MKRMNLWYRLNTGTILPGVLLLLSVGLAFWAIHQRTVTQQRNEHLDQLAQRISADFLQSSDSLRGLLLSPRNKLERERMASAEEDLSKALEEAQGKYATHPDFLSVVRTLRDFLWEDHGRFQAKVMEHLEANPAKAQEFYLQNVDPMATLRDRHLRTLAQQVDAVQFAATAEARTLSRIGWLGGLLLLAASAITIRWQSAAITRPISELITALERMGQGDFSSRLGWNRTDELGIVGTGLDRLADGLSGLVSQVQHSGVQVNTTAAEIAAAAKQQQTTTAKFAATAAEIGDTSKQVLTTSRELSKNMSDVSVAASEAGRQASSSQAAVGRVEGMMRQIMDASGSVTAKLTALHERTTNINSVITTITKVADQTNLLSLNAAIEAEKAGEYGLGFAVVALEIRRLADQTAVATYDIEKLVKEMQSAVAAGVMGMDKFFEEVRRGVEEIRQVSLQLAQTIQQVQSLLPRIQTVSEGMNAQATSAEQITQNLAQLSASAQQTVQSLGQSCQTIEQLNDAARRLQTGAAKFKLEARAGRAN